MKLVQMFVHISGGRGDGRDWPNAGEIIDLGDDEAAQVVRAGLGRYAPEPPVPATDVETRAGATESPADAAAPDDTPRPAKTRQRGAAGGKLCGCC
jgi:hypothetical protein